MKLIGIHVAAARELLRFSQQDLADASGVSKKTIQRFELGEGVSLESIEAMRQALEDRGIIFHNGDKPGAQLDRSIAKIHT